MAGLSQKLVRGHKVIDKYSQQHQQKIIESHSKKYQGWSKTLTDQEINDLFWNNLVNLGWKIDKDVFVLTCSECDTPLKKISKRELESDSITITLDFSHMKLAEHKPKCKAIPESLSK